ncbi:methyltransferase domain-containing protein [Acidithiobacillus sp. MC6.1]|nr:methyltransferase domain-containing protein [Acidithiobacillus sp. MC6.1]
MPHTPADTLSTVLHIGCGPADKAAMPAGFHGAQWAETRCDIDPDVHPDIVADMTDLSGIESGTFDAVYSSHNIEHLYAHQVPVAMNGFSRVLKEEGFVVITCPDVQALGEALAQGRLTETLYESPAGPIAAIDILWGHRGYMARGNLFMAHRVGFTAQVLVNTLATCGFASVMCIRRPSVYDLWALASKSERDDASMQKLRTSYLPS